MICIHCIKGIQVIIALGFGLVCGTAVDYVRESARVQAVALTYASFTLEELSALDI